jgi:Spy/CpxP family protein refolding chaperone
MRKLSVMMMAAALLTSACGVAVQNQEAASSKLPQARHCDGTHDANLGTNFADCEPVAVQVRFEQVEAPGD